MKTLLLSLIFASLNVFAQEVVAVKYRFDTMPYDEAAQTWVKPYDTINEVVEIELKKDSGHALLFGQKELKKTIFGIEYTIYLAITKHAADEKYPQDYYRFLAFYTAFTEGAEEVKGDYGLTRLQSGITIPNLSNFGKYEYGLYAGPYAGGERSYMNMLYVNDLKLVE
jgi:hypothetical protein